MTALFLFLAFLLSMSAFPNGSATFNTGGGITSLNIDYPQDAIGANPTSLDNAYLAIIRGDDDVTISTPSGWSLVTGFPFTHTDGLGQVERLYAFTKTYDASVTSQSFIGSASGRMTGAMFLLGGVSISSPATVTVTNGGQTGVGSSHSTGNVTPAHANSLLIAIFTSPDTPAYFDPPSGMTSYVNVQASSSLGQFGMQIAVVVNAGTSSLSKTATSRNFNTGNAYNVNGLCALIVVNPSQLPTAPTVTYPNGGETITIGTTQTVTWGAASSPTTAASSLKYKVRYSANNGISWTNISALTSAGVTSVSWNTTGLTASSQYLIEVSASSDNGSTFGPVDVSNAVFSLVPESTPAKPTNLSPNSGSGQNRAATIRLSWQHQGGTGNPQTAYAGEYSANADMSSATSFSATSANQFHDLSGGTFGSDQTVYFRVRTTGLTLQSPFSDVVSFVAAAVPATPNITSPIAASPPTSASHTVTFTEASAFTARRYRVVDGGTEVYNSDWVASTALSFLSGYNFQDGNAVDVKLKVRNVFGLESAEDSETVTPSYTAPDAPAITVDSLPADGCNQITFSNTGSLDFNQLYRWVTSEGESTKILIGVFVAENGTFRDFNVRSGVSYTYRGIAVSSTGESAPDDVAATLDLESAWLHILTKTQTTSNSLTAVSINNQSPDNYDPAISVATLPARGRSRPFALMGEHRSRSISVRALITTYVQRQALEDLREQIRDVGLRLTSGFMVKGKIVSFPVVRDIPAQTIEIVVRESDYEEDLS